MHSETADADVPERKTASLVHLFSTLVDGEATDGHEMLFADWVQSGYPLELCRRSIRFAVEEKRSERPAGSRLLPRELRPGFLRSILKRLHDEAAMPMRAGPGQRRGQRPTVAETWERGIASHGPGYYAGGHDLGADEAPERARTGGGDGSV